MFEPCRRIKDQMSKFDKPWFIAGGWAIDLFVGHETREHSDIEIGLFRQDQFVLKNYLNHCDFQKVVKGKLMPWNAEYVELPIHEIHGKRRDGDSAMEILLNERVEDIWLFRRETSITYPIQDLIRISSSGIPFLAPEIVLLYKTKNPREKDLLDFQQVVPLLDREKKVWLKEAITKWDLNHEWISVL
ncbi:hypothetical protein KO561_07010 [Radiobacillus kanasensis]|uniref:nucleotidyltransferase domain-containing protein n=1 Tax=Radiobacillus kanasensis TaxID=2844358 RepID=UPI001E31F2AE|nr:hypothetical protein [Radiobacillus kanasensis]UFU00678.1 hypothetical protein KO561_07010 [Radiobacillus kanasensis]